MRSFGSTLTLNNRYRLDKLIGEGGFASVFLATDLELGRQVAIKVLEANWVKDKELLTRFRSEARAVAALDHPNILQIYDFGVIKGAPYLVMPYISGGSRRLGARGADVDGDHDVGSERTGRLHGQVLRLATVDEEV